MKLIEKALLDQTCAQAKQAPRLRMNYNFNAQLDDPINRLLNAMEPGTYIRPHRHLNPDKLEIFLLLRGQALLFLFDEEGKITDRVLLDPLQGSYGAEIEAGRWHSLLVLQPDTVLYEMKQGPFAPVTAENQAPWSPDPSDQEGVKRFLAWLETAQ